MNFKYFAALLVLPAFWYYLSPIFKTLPKPTGTYQVGIATHEFNDYTIQCWYPADPTPQLKNKPYGQPQQNAWQVKLLAEGWHIPKQAFKHACKFSTNSISNAVISSAKQTYPLIVFLPGYGAPYDFYTALLEDLASHGYIVIAFNTTFVQPMAFADGKFIDPKEGDDIPDAVLVTSMIANFDVTVNWLMQQNSDHQSMWYNHLNLSKLCVMGHSFGGSTAVVIAQQDQRIASGINMDGWKEMKTIQAVPVPFLFLLNDTNFPGQPGKTDGMKEIEQTCALSGPNCKVKVIPGAGHNSFFDLAFLKWPFNKFCDPGTKDPYEVLQNIETEILEFLKEA